MKRILLSILLIATTGQIEAQTQFSGAQGTNQRDLFGAFVSISSNGNRYVVGSPDNPLLSTTKGYVKMYEYDGVSGFNNIGDIQEEVLGDNGAAVAISGDGTRVVIGGYLNDGNGTDSGHVRVYQYNTGWVQVGTDLDGEAAGDNFGVSVAISSDGNVIAVGGHNNDGSGTDSGHVRVYGWNGTTWVQRGQDLEGEAASDNFGVALSMSQDGTKLAIGARYNSAGGTNAGQVRVFSWNGTTWQQMGSDIDGFQVNMSFGSSVSISNSGNSLAVGTPLYDGTIGDQGIVRVYNYSGSNWNQIGQDIIGWNGTSGSNLGKSVSISGDGTAIFVGSSGYSAGSTFKGLAAYYKLVSNVWTQQGVDLLGAASGDRFGFSVAMANDGNKVIVGAPYNPGTRGYIRAYDYSAVLSIDEMTVNNSFAVYPNPVQNQFQLETNTVVDKVEITTLQGQVIKTFDNQESYDISDLSAGIYMLIIHSNTTKGIKKIIKE